MPGLNCYMCPAASFMCPIGILVQAGTAWVAPLLAIGILAMIGAAVGRLACGWICPMGLFQELVHKIPVRKFELPKYLSYGRYAALAIFVIGFPVLLHAKESPLYYCSLCPVATIQSTTPALIGHAIMPHLSKATQQSIRDKSLLTPEENPRSYFYLAMDTFKFGKMVWVKFGILGFFLGLMLFTKRPFCKIFCPLGAFWSFFNQASWLRLKLRLKTCPSCDQCKEICPVDIRVSDKLNSAECVRCLDCLDCGGVHTTS